MSTSVFGPFRAMCSNEAALGYLAPPDGFVLFTCRTFAISLLTSATGCGGSKEKQTSRGVELEPAARPAGGPPAEDNAIIREAQSLSAQISQHVDNFYPTTIANDRRAKIRQISEALAPLLTLPLASHAGKAFVIWNPSFSSLRQTSPEQ